MAFSMNAFKTPSAMTNTVCLVLFLASVTGCQNGPKFGRMQQYQLENERLLSEFRSQKKENEKLRADRSRLLQQQAETEKLAAKLQSQLKGGRTLTAQSQSDRSDFGLGSLKGSNSQSSFDSRPVTDPFTKSNGLSKPDASNLSPRSASNAESLQWRPIRKETR